MFRRAGLDVRIVGIATGRSGAAIDPRGLSPGRSIARARAGDLASLHRGRPIADTLDFVSRVRADILCEISPLDPAGGQPAIAHIRTALRRRMHVVTANKGPVAFALDSLRALARAHDRRFLFEGAVLDGTPLFNLVERCLPGCRIDGFRGVLNATTTRVLTGIERGRSAFESLEDARRAGIVEADPSYDIDGWDAAVKACVIANALMGARARPTHVKRRGIGSVREGDVRAAVAAGHRIRLVARGQRRHGRVALTVRPESLPGDDFLVAFGSDGALVLETDLMREIGVWEGTGGVDQTAYALVSDILTISGARL